jgi:F-box protein 4
VGFHRLSELLRSIWPKKTPKLAMFGPGLETSTSGIARKIISDQSQLFSVVRMFPGQFGGKYDFCVILCHRQ